MLLMCDKASVLARLTRMTSLRPIYGIPYQQTTTTRNSNHILLFPITHHLMVLRLSQGHHAHRLDTIEKNQSSQYLWSQPAAATSEHPSDVIPSPIEPPLCRHAAYPHSIEPSIIQLLSGPEVASQKSKKRTASLQAKASYAVPAKGKKRINASPGASGAAACRPMPWLGT